MNSPLTDQFGRQVTYLRMSVTDRCNFKCTYCMPEGGLKDLGRYNLLTLEELSQISRIFVNEGIRKIRLTGGEPLLRKDIHILIHYLSEIPDLKELCLTTNGHLLTRMMDSLVEAGLQRINVSLDSLRPGRFKEITRGGDLNRVLDGISVALDALPGPVKINVVLSQGWNDDELLDFAGLTLHSKLHVRFIEPMPMSPQASWKRGQVLSVEDIRNRIESELGLEQVQQYQQLDGPASRYRVPGAQGELGFIGAVTDEFCARCNRIRLTPDGKLRGCLMADGEIDLLTILRQGASDEELAHQLHQLMKTKPERHTINDLHFIRPQRTMSQLGG